MTHNPILRVMLACNDPRNGTFRGSFDMLDVADPGGDRLMALEGPPPVVGIAPPSRCGAPPAFFLRGRSGARRGRIWFHAESHRRWSGNWCFDLFTLGLDDVVRLLNLLRKAGWDCHEAETTLFERWREPGPIASDDLLRVLEGDR